MVTTAKTVTNRDNAYVVALYRRYGDDEFYAQSLRKQTVDRDLVERYGFETNPLGDKGALGRLYSLGLLEKPAAGKFRLTNSGAALAKSLEPVTRPATGTAAKET